MAQYELIFKDGELHGLPQPVAISETQATTTGPEVKPQAYYEAHNATTGDIVLIAGALALPGAVLYVANKMSGHNHA